MRKLPAGHSKRKYKKAEMYLQMFNYVLILFNKVPHCTQMYLQIFNYVLILMQYPNDSPFEQFVITHISLQLSCFVRIPNHAS